MSILNKNTPAGSPIPKIKAIKMNWFGNKKNDTGMNMIPIRIGYIAL